MTSSVTRPLDYACIHGVIDGMRTTLMHAAGNGSLVVAVHGPNGQRLTWRGFGGEIDENHLSEAANHAASRRNGHGFSVGVHGVDAAKAEALSNSIDSALQGAIM